MPRDLETEKATLDGMAPLTEETGPACENEPGPSPGDDELSGMPGLSREYSGDLLMHNMQKESLRDQLHPYLRSLTLSDVDSCVKLEESTFPPQERCTREKVSGTTSIAAHRIPPLHLDLAFFPRTTGIVTSLPRRALAI